MWIISITNKMEKTDIVQLTMAYLGCFLMTSWGIWSYSKYNISYADMTGFLIWCVTGWW